ncbi:hypothetical protein FRC12_018972 [Ceratobasidium sp. 428]|nr:hypothetical protein FRC12_018972 [Ceratobasidium sp. 428]
MAQPVSHRADPPSLEWRLCSDVVSQSDVPDILAALEPHAGLLCSLVFTSLYCHDSLVRGLLGFVSGHLKILVLSAVTATFSQRDSSSRAIGSLRGLALLDLYRLDEREICPSLGDLADLLSGSPTLHTLRIRSLYYLPDSSQIHSAIPLPLLRFLEISGVRRNKALELLSKIVPGALELDVRLDAEYFKDDRFNSPGRLFLARSNVVSLAIYRSFLHDYTDQSFTYLASVPHLRVLQLGSMNLARSFAQALGVTFNGQPYLKLPCLRSLCFVQWCIIGSWTVDVVEEITGRIQLQSLAFQSCRFPPTFTRPISRSQGSQLLRSDDGEDADEDDTEDDQDDGNGDGEDYDKYQDEMPESMKDCFSEQVAKVVTVREGITDGMLMVPITISVKPHLCDFTGGGMYAMMEFGTVRNWQAKR